MSLCRNKFRSTLDSIATTLFPSRCLVCHETLVSHIAKSSDQLTESDKPTGTRDAVCKNCKPTIEQEFSISLLSSSHCSCCGYYIGDYQSQASRCIPCSLHPLGVDRILSRWWYLNPVEDLIQTFKYKPELALANYLGLELTQTIREAQKQLPELRWDLVLAVPSSITAMRTREFHHTGELATVVGHQLGLKVDRTALRMLEKELPQAKQKGPGRVTNIRGKIAVSPERVQNKRILLVDDVVTSGSTIDEVAKVLREAQVTSIDAFTLARSVRFQEQRLTVFAAHRQDRSKLFDAH